ncbi:site-specific integrase [Actinoallomurus sp. NPDC052308]|uniref:site-specific integrase n=1 Tax=Actinoallomurus sp. NPDC052308 TaxID=3155530 RepID=UPI00343BE204
MARAAAGLRQGEAFGLVLDRIDSELGMITVDQQVVVIDRRPVLASPKTSASIRDVPMPVFLSDAIDEHVQALQLGADAVLCRTPRGGLLRRDYYNKRIWKPAIKAVGLPEDTPFHDLRHPFASTALAGGVPISEVSRWLGHKSITTTVDLYGHLVPEAGGRARDALDKAFGLALDVPSKCPDGGA